MSEKKKQPPYILIGISIVVTLFVYAFTLDRPGYGTETGPFTTGAMRVFYISEGADRSFYTAGIPFQSEATRFRGADGCPCPDASKLGVILRMVPTYEFLANVLIWSIPPATYLLLHKKYGRE